jgi:TonB family protein
MRRLAIALLVALAAVAASADEPLAVRLVVYHRIPRLAEGDSPEFPSRVLAAPEGGWSDSYDAIRTVLSERRQNRRDVMIEDILIPKLLTAAEPTAFFVGEFGRAVEVKQEGSNLRVTLPKAEPVTVPANGISVVGSADEQYYLAIMPKPATQFIDDALVIINGATPLRIVSRTEPDYPKVDAFRNRSGVFFTELKIAPDGTVSDAHVLDHVNPEIEAAAVNAYKKWRFKPAERNGHTLTAYMIMMTSWHVD